MNKKAIVFVVVLAALLGIGIAGGLLLSGLPITLNGQELHGPVRVLGIVGGVFAAIALLALAILLVPLAVCLYLIFIFMLLIFVCFLLLGIVMTLFLPVLALFLVYFIYRLFVGRGGRNDDATTKPSAGQAEAMD